MRTNNLKFVRNVLYSLKKRYGSPIEYYHINSVVDNVTTGASIINRTKYPIRRAIVLPVTMDRDISRLFSNLPAMEVDSDSRLIIIDKRNLPDDLEVKANDYIITHDTTRRVTAFGGKRFDIQSVEELEDNISLIIKGKYSHNGNRDEIIDLVIKERLVLTESAIITDSTIGGTFPINLPYIF